MKNRACVFKDNQTILHLCKNPIFHKMTKHIDIQYHFIREKITNGIIQVEKVSTDDN